MNAFVQADYGVLEPGIVGLASVGTTGLTGSLLTKKINVFSSSVPNGAALLPETVSQGVELQVNNRTGTTLALLPAPGDQIENLGADMALSIPNGWDVNVVCIDPPFIPQPRTWWVCFLAQALP